MIQGSVSKVQVKVCIAWDSANGSNKADKTYSQSPAALSYSWLRKAVIAMQF